MSFGVASAVFGTVSWLQLPLSTLARLREVRCCLRLWCHCARGRLGDVLSCHSRLGLPTLPSTLPLLHWTVHIPLHTLHFTLHILHSTLYTSHFPLSNLHSTLHTSHFTLHILHSTVPPRETAAPTWFLHKGRSISRVTFGAPWAILRHTSTDHCRRHPDLQVTYYNLVGGAMCPSWKNLTSSMGFGWQPINMKWKIKKKCLKPPSSMFFLAQANLAIQGASPFELPRLHYPPGLSHDFPTMAPAGSATAPSRHRPHPESGSAHRCCLGQRLGTRMDLS